MTTRAALWASQKLVLRRRFAVAVSEAVVRYKLQARGPPGGRRRGETDPTHDEPGGTATPSRRPMLHRRSARARIRWDMLAGSFAATTSLEPRLSSHLLHAGQPYGASRPTRRALIAGGISQTPQVRRWSTPWCSYRSARRLLISSWSSDWSS
jgi:hypothetical protein